MQFTFVFESKEGENLSYLLCFIPCPVWKKGDQELTNLHPEFPHFKIGDIKSLIEKENLHGIKKNALVIHNAGHGSNMDLQNILTEIEGLNLSCTIISLK
jgi:hypothetical protein